ncbi:MAG: Hpt domain-containing protein [Candidatus Methanoperedens sp.]|nr:Hpt domain-containing protein [Candidatus Methanoperedens sp.]
MDDMSEYKEMYAVEAAEHLQSMNEALLNLEKDPENSETINVMFRAAHTLKGMSATMGYTNIKELTHEMENLMDSVRKNEMKLDSAAIDILFEGLDTLEKMAETPENCSQFDISALIGKISLLSKRETGAEATGQVKTPDTEAADVTHDSSKPYTSQEKVEDGCTILDITVTLHESCVLKSARSTVVMRNLSELGEIIETHPSIKEIEDEKFDREFKIVVSTKEEAAKLEKSIMGISEIAKVEIKTHEGTQAKAKVEENYE